MFSKQRNRYRYRMAIERIFEIETDVDVTIVYRNMLIFQ